MISSESATATAVSGFVLCAMMMLTLLSDQITMLDVMEKYGPMEKLEHLRLRNLSMGSLLIILPFAPNLRTLCLRYNAARGGAAAASEDSAAPNLTDDLFVKIFQRNQGTFFLGFRRISLFIYQF